MQNVAKIGLAGASFLILLALKLCGALGWSWFWITSPLWASTVVVVFAAIGMWVLTRDKGQPTNGR